MSTAVAAIDLGATSGRVVVGRVGADTLHASTVARFPNTPVQTPDGLHWDILALYSGALEGLRAALRATPQIASIGVDSWAVDYGLLRGGQLLGNPFHYRDRRTDRGVLAVHRDTAHPQLFRRNGLQFLPFNTLYQLAAERRDVLSFADQLLLIPDLIAFWLTGKSRAEVTNASTTGLMSAQDGTWDDETLDRLGVPRELLPRLIAPGESYGPISGEVRRAIGASSPIPVTAVGSHDTASAVVAVPMDPDEAVYISCGTWGLIGAEVPSPLLSDAVRAAGFTNEGGVDGQTRLLHNVMGLWILSETVREWERAGRATVLDELIAAAAAVTTPVAVFDPDDPYFLSPGDMTPRIDAWCKAEGIEPPRTDAEYARSIIESLAAAFAATARDAAALARIPLRTIHIVGGGALNTLLCQRTADRAGTPVFAGPVEATALGNVLVQARAVGAISGSLADLRALVRRTHPPTLYLPF